MDFNQIAALSPADQFKKTRGLLNQFEGDRKLTDEEIREVIAASFRWPSEQSVEALEKHRDLTARGLISVAQNGWFSPSEVSLFGRFSRNEEQIWSAPEVKNYQGLPSRRTRLMYAAKEGDEKTVRFLLQRGADVRLQDDQDQDALHYACFQCKTVNGKELDDQPWRRIAKLLLNPYNPEYWPGQRVPPPSCHTSDNKSISHVKYNAFHYSKYTFSPPVEKDIRDQIRLSRMQQILRLPELLGPLETDYDPIVTFLSMMNDVDTNPTDDSYDFFQSASLDFLRSQTRTTAVKLQCLYKAVRIYCEKVDPELPRNELYPRKFYDVYMIQLCAIGHFFNVSVFPTPFTTLILHGEVLHHVEPGDPNPRGSLDYALKYVYPSKGLLDVMRNIGGEAYFSEFSSLTEEQKNTVRNALPSIFTLCPSIVGGTYPYFLYSKYRPSDLQYLNANELVAPSVYTVSMLAKWGQTLWNVPEDEQKEQLKMLLQESKVRATTLHSALKFFMSDNSIFYIPNPSESVKRRQKEAVFRFVRSFANDNISVPVLRAFQPFVEFDFGFKYRWDELHRVVEQEFLDDVEEADYYKDDYVDPNP